MKEVTDLPLSAKQYCDIVDLLDVLEKFDSDTKFLQKDDTEAFQAQ